MQEVTRQDPEVFYMDDEIDLEPHRSQTRLKTSEQTDAKVEFEVADEHKRKARWRTITMRNAKELVRQLRNQMV